jgi:hypothetical protein
MAGGLTETDRCDERARCRVSVRRHSSHRLVRISPHLRMRAFGMSMGCLFALIGGMPSIAQSDAIDAGNPPTADEIAKLEPERCEIASSNFRAATAALPFLVGSASRDMKIEQIALIDQYKESNRRKVWIVRVPAAFISYRTCDSGRQNWTSESDSLSIGQHYQLSLVVLPDRVVPLTRASDEEKKAGVQVTVDLRNSVRDPAFRHGVYHKSSNVVGRVGTKGPPRCRDAPSDVPGLVKFKRIDPNIRHANDCEGSFTNGVYTDKLGDLTYDFVVFCAVNCRARRDFVGWDVEYSYHHTKLAEWRGLHERLNVFLKRHTVHLDNDAKRTPV